MMAEKALKQVHNAMLNKDFDTAVEAGIQALVETKLMVLAIKDMKDAANG
jgi:hypothetical protein